MTAEQLARRRATRLYPNSTSFQSVFCKGARASRAGVPADRCPYKHDPRKTWRAAFRSVWISGWQSERDPLES